MAPPAGTLRTQMELQKPRRIVNDYAEAEVHWEHVQILWVNFKRQTGSEQFEGEAVEAHKRAMVVSRYVDDIAPDYRLKHPDGTVWQIESVIDPEDRHMRLEIGCRLEVA